MRTLILATVSAIALGIAGAAPSYAQNATASPGATATPPAANSGATTGAATMAPTTPATGAAPSAMPQTGASAPQPTTPSLGNNSQYNKPYMANASSSGPTAERVTRGEVRQAQEKLRSDGLYRGRVDGLMGPETRQALRQYQQKSGLQTTARLDQDTLNSLLGAGVGQGSSMPASSAPSSAAGTNASGAGGWNNTNPSNSAK